MMRAYASCDQLSTSVTATATAPTMGMKKDLFSAARPGKVVTVYDGRKWPVVRRGSVYVNADDTARRVTQAAVCSTAVAEKKRRAGKYTVAVGTSHGHVQAFLEDADNVLDTLDRCQTEDKCLMLIKRPKESARKMLKSQALTQMSVSDPQLNRQFNGLQLTQVHQHAQTVSPTHQDEQAETQSTTSNSTEGSEPHRRYASVKDRLMKQPPPQYSGVRRPPPDYYRNDPSSSSSCNPSDVYQYLPRRDLRDPIRRDLRYSSIPEDEDQEINNNQQQKGSSPDPSSLPCANHGYSNVRGHVVRHDQTSNHPPMSPHRTPTSSNRTPQCANHTPQSPNHTPHSPKRTPQSSSHTLHSPHHTPHNSNCTPHSPSHTPHSPNHVPPNRLNQRQNRGPTYEQSRNGHAPSSSSQSEWSSQMPPSHDHGEMVVDAHGPSVNNNPGLTTFSLVGQCKSGGVTFSSPTSQRRAQTARQGPGEADPYWDASAEGAAARSHHRYMTNGQPTRSSEKMSAPGCSSSGSEHLSGVPVSPSHHHYHHHQQVSNHSHQHLTNGGDVELPRGSHQYMNGHAYSHDSSGVPGPLGTPQTVVMSPLRIRTNLPPAPVTENSERLKRFTEVMRCRTSLSSCGDMSTTSSLSHTPTILHTPPSRQSSTTDTAGWDSEVSTLLDVRVGDGGDSSSPSRKPTSDARGEGVSGKRGCAATTCQDKVTGFRCSSSQETPQGDQHSDGGHTSAAHSHSSTMDSGYTTNTEGEGDSSLNHLSPPYHPSYSHLHPVLQTPHVHTEPYRPVPMPRNLFPTSTARKCHHSMQQTSGGSSGGIQHTPHSPSHTVLSEGKRIKGSPPSSQQKRAVSHCIQINGNPVDHQAVSDQRSGWDSASSFKSLELAPAGAGGAAAAAQVDPTVASSSSSSTGDDLVLKPQAVTRSGDNGVVVDKPPSPSRFNEADSNKPDNIPGKNTEGGEGGGGGGSSTTEHRPPSSPPPPPPEANSVITVPGHWNHTTTNTTNIVNNNNNAPNSIVVPQHGSPRFQPRPTVKTTPIPTLFQLSQNYDLCSARLVTPGSLCASSLLTLTTVQVTLPALGGEGGGSASSQSSPQGHCARIGGPGSAFRPVRTGSATSTPQTTDLTAVDTVDDQCGQHVTLGDLQSGDLLLEVNGWQCMGHDISGIHTLLDSAQDVTLVLARPRKETSNNRVQELESSVHTLEEEVGRLSEDLSKKDARIQELSSLMPWPQGPQNGETALILQSEDDEAFVVGENEFVV